MKRTHNGSLFFIYKNERRIASDIPTARAGAVRTERVSTSELTLSKFLHFFSLITMLPHGVGSAVIRLCRRNERTTKTTTTRRRSCDDNEEKAEKEDEVRCSVIPHIWLILIPFLYCLLFFSHVYLFQVVTLFEKYKCLIRQKANVSLLA